MKEKLDIKQIADFLGVNQQTLRRWDESGKLKSHRDTPTSHRYYYADDLEDFLMGNYKYLYRIADIWAFEDDVDIISGFYCQDAYIFKSRLEKLEQSLKKDKSLEKNFSLITSVVGEIGNNSFDHNIGNWPRIPGIFFSYDLNKKIIILVDKGQGVLTTLKKVKKDLKNDKEALKIAFTKIISGRAPESRGNGLKYVKKVVESNNMNLYFHSGEALVFISNRKKELNIMDTDRNMQGCFVTLNY